MKPRASDFLALPPEAQRKVVLAAMGLVKLTDPEEETRSLRQTLKDLREECRDDPAEIIDNSYLEPALTAELKARRARKSEPKRARARDLLAAMRSGLS